MLFNEFRLQFLEAILTFLWKEWATLGVSGGSQKEERWILDPEALLVFSLPLARYEPRLFDEIIGWLLTNGHWLDTARLRNILHANDRDAARVAGAALQYCARHGVERKWKSLADFCWEIFKQQPQADSVSPLFIDKSGHSHPLISAKKVDPDFILFYLNRAPIKNLKEGKEVPVNAGTNIRFLLRALFGVGGRSEYILYLLTHEGGRVRDIADGVGLFWLGVQQTLKDLSISGLIHTRAKGNKIEYWLSQKKWWEFLNPSISDLHKIRPKPRWVHWSAIFSALLSTWKTIDLLSQNPASDYMISSKQEDCLEQITKNFMRAGIDIPPYPTGQLSIKQQRKTILNYCQKIFEND